MDFGIVPGVEEPSMNRGAYEDFAVRCYLTFEFFGTYVSGTREP